MQDIENHNSYRCWNAQMLERKAINVSQNQNVDCLVSTEAA